MTYFETTYRDFLGGQVIRSRLGLPAKRLGLENRVFAGVEVGLLGWERSHSQGAGTGHESPLGIVYAPMTVNRVYQRSVERFLQELVAESRPGIDLWLTTVTRTHCGTRRLKSIEYQVDEVIPGRTPRTLFAVSIDVENARHNPRVCVSATLK